MASLRSRGLGLLRADETMADSKSLKPCGAVLGSQASNSLKVWIVRPPDRMTTPSSLTLAMSSGNGEGIVMRLWLRGTADRGYGNGTELRGEYRNGINAFPRSIRRCGSNVPSMETSMIGIGHGDGNINLNGTKTP